MYFDTRSKRSKIFGVHSSNSGYHPKWIYLYRTDSEFVRPCPRVTKDTIDYLNGLEKYDTEYLNSFQGSRPIYSHLDQKNSRFLEKHARKACLPFFFCLLECVVNMSHFYKYGMCLHYHLLITVSY